MDAEPSLVAQPEPIKEARSPWYLMFWHEIQRHPHRTPVWQRGGYTIPEAFEAVFYQTCHLPRGMQADHSIYKELLKSRITMEVILDRYDEAIIRTAENEAKEFQAKQGAGSLPNDQPIGTLMGIGKLRQEFIAFVKKYPIIDANDQPINLDRPEYIKLAQARHRDIETEGLALIHQLIIFHIMALHEVGNSQPVFRKPSVGDRLSKIPRTPKDQPLSSKAGPSSVHVPFTTPKAPKASEVPMPPTQLICRKPKANPPTQEFLNPDLTHQARATRSRSSSEGSETPKVSPSKDPKDAYVGHGKPRVFEKHLVALSEPSASAKPQSKSRKDERCKPRSKTPPRDRPRSPDAGKKSLREKVQEVKSRSELATMSFRRATLKGSRKSAAHKEGESPDNVSFRTCSSRRSRSRSSSIDIDELRQHKSREWGMLESVSKDLNKRREKLESKDCPGFVDSCVDEFSKPKPKVSDATHRTIQAHLPKEKSYARGFEGGFRKDGSRGGPPDRSYESSSSVFATPTTPGNTKFFGYSDSDTSPPRVMSAGMYDGGDNLVKPQPGFKMTNFLKQWDLPRFTGRDDRRGNIARAITKELLLH
jgi:hypothetical protein